MKILFHTICFKLHCLCTFKRPLVAQLFLQLSNRGLVPLRVHALAVRDRLANDFPEIFAPGKLFHPTLANGDGWSNGQKDKDILMDNVFANIEARIAIVKQEDSKVGLAISEDAK